MHSNQEPLDIIYSMMVRSEIILFKNRRTKYNRTYCQIFFEYIFKGKKIALLMFSRIHILEKKNVSFTARYTPCTLVVQSAKRFDWFSTAEGCYSVIRKYFIMTIINETRLMFNYAYLTFYMGYLATRVYLTALCEFNENLVDLY